MISALDSKLSSPGLSPVWGYSVVFLGKTLYFHSVPLHPGVQMGTSEFNAGIMLRLASHPGGVEIILVTSHYNNLDKLWPGRPLGLYADFTFFNTPLFST